MRGSRGTEPPDWRSALSIDLYNPPPSQGAIEMITDGVGRMDDVELVSSTPGSRREINSKRTLILDATFEEQLEGTGRGQRLLQWIGTSVMGQMTQFILLMACLCIYTFTPVVIDYSS